MLTLRRDDCPTISADASASLDGVPLELFTEGGLYDDIAESGCDPIRFSLDHPAVRRGLSTLVLRDSTATWTIDVMDALSADFTMTGTPAPGAQVAVTWTNATMLDPNETFGRITNANGETTWISTQLGMPTQDQSVEGNTVRLKLPNPLNGTLLTIASSRRIQPHRCDGPSECFILLGVSVGYSLP